MQPIRSDHPGSGRRAGTALRAHRRRGPDPAFPSHLPGDSDRIPSRRTPRKPPSAPAPASQKPSKSLSRQTSRGSNPLRHSFECFSNAGKSGEGETVAVSNLIATPPDSLSCDQINTRIIWTDRIAVQYEFCGQKLARKQRVQVNHVEGIRDGNLDQCIPGVATNLLSAKRTREGGGQHDETADPNVADCAETDQMWVATGWHPLSFTMLRLWIYELIILF